MFGINIDIFTKDSLIDCLNSLRESSSCSQIVTANALLLLETQRNPDLFNACRSAEIVLPESSGLRWALSFLGQSKPFHWAGVDLSFYLCQWATAHSLSVFLLGGEPGVADGAAQYLKEKIPGFQLAGCHDGFFDPPQNEAILKMIRNSGAKVVLVATGMPKQDVWIYAHKRELPGTLCMGVGGTLDIWAGRLKRAPLWIQRNGLEWLYRFWQEPSRWRRMAQLPLFVLKVLGQRLRQFATILHR